MAVTGVGRRWRGTQSSGPAGDQQELGQPAAQHQQQDGHRHQGGACSTLRASRISSRTATTSPGIAASASRPTPDHGCRTQAATATAATPPLRQSPVRDPRLGEVQAPEVLRQRHHRVTLVLHHTRVDGRDVVSRVVGAHDVALVRNSAATMPTGANAAKSLPMRSRSEVLRAELVGRHRQRTQRYGQPDQHHALHHEGCVRTAGHPGAPCGAAGRGTAAPRPAATPARPR